MKKVPSVTQVRVSLKDGLTILDLKPDNRTTLAELRQIIKNNGFVSKDVSAVARGSFADSDTFVVSGTSERLSVAAAPQASGEVWRIVVRSPR